MGTIKQQKYDVTLTGRTDQLQHALDYILQEELSVWRRDPKNKKLSVKGSDMSPAWTWTTYIYAGGDPRILIMPTDNLMANIRDGAKQCPAKKGMGTLRAIAQRAIVVNEPFWPLLVDGKTIPADPIKALVGETDFAKHQAYALENNFELFVKPVVIMGKKHIRVRPRFHNWTLHGTITLLESMMDESVMGEVLTMAGLGGLGDYRPGSPHSGGIFGQFDVEYTRIK